ncbi:MAG: pseudouridine synthase, partial [Bacteroidota bacterium]
TGALLLTTDGDLAHRLMHPRYGAVKTYIVTTERPVQETEVASLVSGVELEDGRAAADHAERFADDPRRLALQLHEGRNRQVRRMIEAISHSVVTLDRIGYAGLDLDGLRRGRWRHLQPQEVNALRRSVKLKAIVFESTQ